MRELERILAAWSDREERGESAVLATVVDVRGSAYRRPGARMFIAADGERIGTISGGCLEGDVTKKAWWWTESGQAKLRTYDTTSDDDAVWEFGLGCNGVVRVLLERLGGEESRATLDFLRACCEERRPGVLATVIAAPASIGQRLLLKYDGTVAASPQDPRLAELLEADALEALEAGTSRLVHYELPDGPAEAFIEVIAPPTPLLIFGAGHDAMPLVRIGKELGWHVTVADGRPSYAAWRRIPLADEVVLTQPSDLFAGISLERDTVAVVMNHNYPVDRAVMGRLLTSDIRYVGVLGPRARTEKMLNELGIFDVPGCLHAPIGLDIGAETPETIALSIVAEIQAVLGRRKGGKLRERSQPIYSEAEPLARQAVAV